MADEAFRANPPFATAGVPWAPPSIAERTQTNGIRVLVVEKHEAPIVALRIVSDRGADQSDRGIPEVWAESILRGGKQHPWYDVRDDFDRMAVRWEAAARPDATEIQFEVLSKLFAPAVELIGDLVVEPDVSLAELERAQNRVRTKIGSSDLKVVARRALGHVFYPHGHPYNEPFAPSENVPRVTTDLVLAYHRAAFTPLHTTIVVAGDVDAVSAFSTIEKAFARLAGPTLGAVAPPPTPPVLPETRITLIDKSVPAQAYLSAAWFAPTVGSEDEIAMSFARQVLMTRLFDDVRRDRGATYGLRMATPIGRGAQLTRVEGYVQLDAVDEAIKDLLANLDVLSHEPPNEGVMSFARIGATSDVVGAFDGPTRTADALALLGVRNAPVTFFSQRLDAMREANAAHVLRAAQKWLATDAVRFVVVGDASVLRAKLEALGIGPVKVRTAFLP